MKNAFLRVGRTCVSTVVAAGMTSGPGIATALLPFALMVQALLPTAAVAGSVNPVTVTLPHAVTVRSVTLPEGTYVMDSIDMGSGLEYFVIRGEHGVIATLQAAKHETEGAAKTELVFDRDGDTWHFDKLVIKGDPTSYVFQK
jgi:hypothetical protein